MKKLESFQKELEDGSNSHHSKYSHSSGDDPSQCQTLTCELPGGQVPLESVFYIERPPIEARCYEEILRPGSLIRIKASRQRGKTSLMARILHQAREQGYHTVTLSLQLAAKTVFADLDRFLQWLCASVGKSLELPNRLSEYWDDIFGSNYNSTDYFENYLLAQLENPVVLALDDLDRVFQYPDIAFEFLGLLRAWYEKAKYGDSSSAIWGKLRLIILHSTEAYVPLNINQSPFNVGLSIELPEFTFAQVQDLSSRYGLQLSGQQLEKLMELIGGNPYLVQAAFYPIVRQDLTFEELLRTAPTDTGIYKEHLQRQLTKLQQEPELVSAFEQVVTSPVAVEIDASSLMKLQSLGLVRLQSHRVIVSHLLYRHYFQTSLEKTEPLIERIQKLEKANQELQHLVRVDGLTQLMNRRYFDEYLTQEWQRLTRENLFLSLILCDVDFFKAYNDTYGHPAGDSCLQKVAEAIAHSIRRPADLAARYGGEEFALILPNTPPEGALQVAEQIRAKVRELNITHINSFLNYVTVSLGVAAIIPRRDLSYNLLIGIADQALYQAKSQGRDRVVIKLL